MTEKQFSEAELLRTFQEMVDAPDIYDIIQDLYEKQKMAPPAEKRAISDQIQVLLSKLS